MQDEREADWSELRTSLTEQHRAIWKSFRLLLLRTTAGFAALLLLASMPCTALHLLRNSVLDTSSANGILTCTSAALVEISRLDIEFLRSVVLTLWGVVAALAIALSVLNPSMAAENATTETKRNALVYTTELVAVSAAVTAVFWAAGIVTRWVDSARTGFDWSTGAFPSHPGELVIAVAAALSILGLVSVFEASTLVRLQNVDYADERIEEITQWRRGDRNRLAHRFSLCAAVCILLLLVNVTAVHGYISQAMEAEAGRGVVAFALTMLALWIVVVTFTSGLLNVWTPGSKVRSPDFIGLVLVAGLGHLVTISTMFLGLLFVMPWWAAAMTSVVPVASSTIVSQAVTLNRYGRRGQWWFALGALHVRELKKASKLRHENRQEPARESGL